ncbi:S-adenosyl-L-methionine-dependent methyltransferase [Lophiotrema nucula]|uniref:S-adenosyl-L-methionine-dependent methyltransferase n=1 Tax=Lophiotrema nucula TaxID=690887 RepID=A0A6A5ZT54_9PLEO|nr:S-adenosyl-L-methionine-dependent methyltransferase [Lophiotrema nucula]
MSVFTPKQAVPRQPSYFALLAGDITDRVAHKLLPLLPPITSESIVHDNACGLGAVTKAIMHPSSPSPCRIKATDINTHMLESLHADSVRNHWPVETEAIPAQELPFEDNTFTHSINSFSIMLVEQDADVIAHVYRTLKPGGAALFSIWNDPILVRAVLAAHRATRPADMPVPPAVQRGSFDAAALTKLLEGSDFAQHQLTWTTAQESMLVDDLRHWLTVAWTFLGQTNQGWLREDEENWNAAIRVMEQTVKGWNGYEGLAGEAAILIMKADVVVAMK